MKYVLGTFNLRLVEVILGLFGAVCNISYVKISQVLIPPRSELISSNHGNRGGIQNTGYFFFLLVLCKLLMRL